MAADIHHRNVWTVDEKVVQSLIRYYWIFETQLHVHLKKWTLKFKLLYLLNHICYLITFADIWPESSPVNAINLVKNFLQFQKYIIFRRGLFFGAPCIHEGSSPQQLDRCNRIEQYRYALGWYQVQYWIIVSSVTVTQNFAKHAHGIYSTISSNDKSHLECLEADSLEPCARQRIRISSDAQLLSGSARTAATTPS